MSRTPADLIDAKRRGESHSREDLSAFLEGYLAGRVPDYQVAAWLMAVCFQRLNEEETGDLTLLMAESGDVLDLSSLPHHCRQILETHSPSSSRY